MEFTGNTTNEWNISGNNYEDPELVDVIEKKNRVEIIYKQRPNIMFMGPNTNHPKIFKHVYEIEQGQLTCKTVEGKYIPAKDWTYVFEE